LVVVLAGVKIPKSKSRKKAPTLPGMAGIDVPTVVRFARDGSVVREGERRTVVIASRRVGSWEPGERGIRNALMVKLAEDPSIIFEELARAFEVSSETLRLQRRLYEQEGLAAVLKRGEAHHKGGRQLGPAVRRKMERLFAEGKTTSEVVAMLKGRVHRSSTDTYRRRWESKRAARGEPAQQAELPLGVVVASPKAESAAQPPPEVSASELPAALSIAVEAPAASDAGATPSQTAAAVEPDELPPIRAPRQESSERAARAAPVAEPAPSEGKGARAEIAEFAPFSSKGVQHVGAWLLLVTIAGLGVYAHVRKHERRRPEGRPLRVAIDALLSALGFGGRCVESVRRLGTSSITAALLADAAPSATWVRRTLGGYCAGKVSEQLLKDVSGDLLLAARERTPRGKPVVLFFDNHGRAYTGMHSLRRIWRMQDKRTVPGALEYWVHDAEGRPVLVIPVAPNESLPQTLRAWVAFLREKLGEKTPLMLVFDRAGAFPGLWKWLRDSGVQFVTYQRASYRKFRREWFERHGRPMTLREANGAKVKVTVQAGRMNLGARRGRVRRIRILMPDDVQMNVVASSSQSAKWLCQTLFTRWRQENALKHGVERWGINQLDGRQVEDVPAGTMVTNPLRSNLDRVLREDRDREKKLRLQLQQLYPGHPDRRELKRMLDDNLESQRDVLKARHKTPKKVPIERTDLHGELKQHTREYKLLLDTLRLAAQNAEAELAAGLSANLPRPAEAKRLLQNVFGAPGDIRVSSTAITVTLSPAANRPEAAALAAFFANFNQRRLSHPGDPFSRPVCFRLQTP
jgi:hypothetical protein